MGLSVVPVTASFAVAASRVTSAGFLSARDGREPASVPPMSAMRRRIVGALVASAVLVGAGVLWSRSKIPEVTVVSVERGQVVETLAIIGRVAPQSEVRFAAREGTSITQAPVEEGDAVAAGQLLLHMDDAEASAIVAQAEASLAQAKARTREVQTVTSKTAAARQAETRAELENAKRTADREQGLFSKGVLTAADVDRARTALTVARQRKRAADLAAAATSKRGAQWQAALAAETFAEAGLLIAQARMERLSLRAPAAGLVKMRSVEVGDVVQPGTSLMTLVLDGPKELVIEPDEKNLALLSLGQAAMASAEAFPDQRFEATLDYIAPSVDATRGTIEVRLAVPNPPEALRTDMTVSVDIVVGESTDAFTLPASAVMDLASEAPWIYVVASQRLDRRDVVIGRRGGAQVEITQGVTSEDRVVAKPSGALEVGARVRVVEG